MKIRSMSATRRFCPISTNLNAAFLPLTLEATLREAVALQTVPLCRWERFCRAGSQIPTFLICEMARRNMTVALSGDGGDELFGGYNRYFWGLRVWGPFGRLPSALRKSLGAGVEFVPSPVWDAIGRAFTGANGVVRLGDKAHKLARRLWGQHLRGRYDWTTKLWNVLMFQAWLEHNT